MVVVIYLKCLLIYGGLFSCSRLFTLGTYLVFYGYEGGVDFNCVYASKMGTVCSQATVIYSSYCDLDFYYLNEYRSQLCVYEQAFINEIYESVFISRNLLMGSP
jgi:hypothetical protein